MRRVLVGAGCFLGVAIASHAEPRLVATFVQGWNASPEQPENPTQHFVAYSFAGGAVVSTDTLLTDSGSAAAFCRRGIRLYRQRYLLSSTGDIVDLVAREVLHRGGTDAAAVQLVCTRGDSVILRRVDGAGAAVYDLSRRRLDPLPGPTAYDLPGTPAPGANRSVAWGEGPSDGLALPRDRPALWLIEGNGKRKLLGTRFSFQLAPFSSLAWRTAPLMWLDDERLVTQERNGRIVIVGIDGSITSLVDIPLQDAAAERPERGLTLEGSATHASFLRDTDGDIIYAIDPYNSDRARRRIPRLRHFKIDPETGRTTEPDMIRLPLGEGFDVTLSTDPVRCRTIRYRGREIGCEKFESSDCAYSRDGIAVVTPSDLPWDPRIIKVWTAKSEAWTTVRPQDPSGTTTAMTIVGWIDDS